MKAAQMAAIEHMTGDVYRVGCDIERELNAANDRIKRLEEELNELRSDESRLLNSNGELERRIKLLEEAGDALLNANNDDEEYKAIKHWNKSKEAKP
jgi:predicted nuclease with TOPRIM domain